MDKLVYLVTMYLFTSVLKGGDADDSQGKTSSLIQSTCTPLCLLLTCYQSAVNKLESRTLQFEKTWTH